MVTSVTHVKGKVAKILNDREVVINRGESDGVKLGARFKVIETVNVEDPDTKETIGTIEREKIRFKITHLEPAMSIARTYETYTYGGNLSDRGGDPLLQRLYARADIPRTDVKRIRVDHQGTVPIEIGDVVVEVTE